MSHLVAPDGYGDVALWHTTDGQPVAVLRELDLPPAGRHLWPLIVAALTDDGGDSASCCPDPECCGNPCDFPGYAANH